MKNWVQRKIKNRKITKELLDKYFDNISGFQRLLVNIDFRIDHIFHGSDLIDYLQYDFYWQKNRGRRRFGTAAELKTVLAVCNDKDKSAIFDNKLLFNKTFEKYIRRDWLGTRNCTYEDFLEFVNKHSDYFVKPVDSLSGYGTGIESAKDSDTGKLFEKHHKNNNLLEEIVKQDARMAAFNESTVNTLRIVSLLTANNNVEILAAVLRMGRAGKVADNFHQQGIAAIIDIDTGIVKTTGIDGEFRRYVIHPDSNKPIVGFEIPEWHNVLSVIKEAACIVPEVRYVGWDVAINSKGEPLLIEGNSNPDFDVTQVPDKEGKWSRYSSLIQDLVKYQGIKK